MKEHGHAFRAVVTLALLHALAACGDSTGPDGQFSGQYELRTVNGDTLPYVVLQVGADRSEVTAGQLQANNDGRRHGTFSVAFTTRITQGGQATTKTESSGGTWGQTGNQVRFLFSSGSLNTGDVSGNEITLIDANMSFVFRK